MLKTGELYLTTVHVCLLAQYVSFCQWLIRLDAVNVILLPFIALVNGEMLLTAKANGLI